MGKKVKIVNGVNKLVIEDYSEIIYSAHRGISIELEPDAVAVYYAIIDADMIGDVIKKQKCKAWFKENYLKEYYILFE